MIPQPDIHFPSLGVVHLFGHEVDLTIHSFGVLVATGILVGAWATRRRGRELGLEDELVSQMVTTVLVWGFIVAHLFDVVAYQGPDRFSLGNLLNIFGGFSSFGGFVGALAGLVYFGRKHKQPLMPYADALAFGLAPGWMFGRLGCFTAGDHPGRLTTFFLAVNYHRNGVEGLRHDLGFYEALWAMVMTAIFLVLARRKRPLGLYVTLLALAYAPVRFLLDFLRATDVSGADPRYFGLTPAQYGSLLMMVAAGVLVKWMRSHRVAEN